MAKQKFDHQEAMRLLATGMTLQAVGKIFGVSRERIRQVARKFGVHYPTERRQVEDRDGKILIQIAAGKKTCVQIADEFGVCPVTVRKIAREAGFKPHEISRNREIEKYWPLLRRVRDGESFYSVAGGNHVLHVRLMRLAKHIGVVSVHGRRHDFSARGEIIRDGIDRGLSLEEIRAKVEEAEGKPIRANSIVAWAQSHGIDFPQIRRRGKRGARKPCEVKTPRVERSPLNVIRRGNWAPSEIEDIVRARGSLTAFEIAKKYGVSRNAIIGIWNRNKERYAPIVPVAARDSEARP